MQTHTILVTQAEYDKASDVFAAAPGLDCRPAPADEAALAALVRDTGCRAVVLGVAPYRDALYDALADNAGENGALIVRFGLGTDGINKPCVAAKGLTLVNTPVDIQTSVAELTIFMIGALMRRIPRLDKSIRNGDFTAICGRELCGQTFTSRAIWWPSDRSFRPAARPGNIPSGSRRRAVAPTRDNRDRR